MNIRYKYKRTYHLPWSPGMTSDDKMMRDTHCFDGKEVVVTVKLDGENSTLYSDFFHARSMDSAAHPSQDWLKKFHSNMAYNIPEGWRICGENLYAKHSIEYKDLETYFYVFSIWNKNNICLSWDETLEYAQLLDLHVVPELYRGIWDEELIKTLYRPVVNGNPCEGYVVRIAAAFHYTDFATSIAKYVRKGHVNTFAQHWKQAKVIPNKLK